MKVKIAVNQFPSLNPNSIDRAVSLVPRAVSNAAVDVTAADDDGFAAAVVDAGAVLPAALVVFLRPHSPRTTPAPR